MLAIEYCGLYWHAENMCGNTAKNKHSLKLKECEAKGVRLITIFEDEWILKPDQTKGYLRAILGKAENKCDARKCEIRELVSSVAKEFHNNNHIQGHSNGRHFGLFFKDDLVAISTFSKPSASRNNHRNNEDKYELGRYTVKVNYSVRGGLGKLLSYFIKNNPTIKNIVSYSDNRWSSGNIYKTLNFDLINTGAPSYFYFKNGELKKHHRYNFTKHRALELFGGDPETETEWDIMCRSGYDRIWDCGSTKWNLKVNQ